ncbi:MAG: hypothetical protein V7785_14345 [Bermanella sp.]
MKTSILGSVVVLMLIVGVVTGAHASNYPEYEKDIPDWRVTGTPAEQLKALVKVTPGTHHWMPEIAYRYQSLYWAGQQGKWEFAGYQARSMEKMIKRVANARAKRAPAIKHFRENVFPDLYQSVEKRNFEALKVSIAKTSAECMACHAKEGFAYITVPAVPPKPNNLVLGFPK